jgi:hypothetical protein
MTAGRRTSTCPAADRQAARRAERGERGRGVQAVAAGRADQAGHGLHGVGERIYGSWTWQPCSFSLFTCCLPGCVH